MGRVVGDIRWWYCQRGEALKGVRVRVPSTRGIVREKAYDTKPNRAFARFRDTKKGAPMKVTMRVNSKSGGRTYLWDVIVDGLPIGGDRPEGYSMGRVLRMGNRYLPILDADKGKHGIGWGSMSSRKDAAEFVAETAVAQGY